MVLGEVATSYERGNPVHREFLTDRKQLFGRRPSVRLRAVTGVCEDRVRDGPASGGKGSKGRNYLDCIRGNGLHLPEEILSLNCITVPDPVLTGYLAHKKLPPPRTLQ